MKKLHWILLAYLCCIFVIFPEEKTNDDLSHYIGAAAGFSTGYGLSYRYWPGQYGAQVVFTPYADDSGYIINLGTAGFRNLHNSTHTKLYLFLAGNGTLSSYNYEGGITYEEELLDTEVDIRKDMVFNFAVGFGPGFEIYLFKNLVIDLMFGYRYSTGGITSGLGFTAEVAVYYRF